MLELEKTYKSFENENVNSSIQFYVKKNDKNTVIQKRL